MAATADARAGEASVACGDLSSCDRCAEQPQCGWCGGKGGTTGSCIAATDAALGECGAGGFVQYDASACKAEDADPVVGLVDQLKALKPVMAMKRH